MGLQLAMPRSQLLLHTGSMPDLLASLSVGCRESALFWKPSPKCSELHPGLTDAWNGLVPRVAARVDWRRVYWAGRPVE